MGFKLQFWYTLLLNHTNCFDQFMNLFLQLFYEKIGPNNAFQLWWSVFVFENIGNIFVSFLLVELLSRYIISRIKIDIQYDHNDYCISTRPGISGLQRKEISTFWSPKRALGIQVLSLWFCLAPSLG